MILLKHGFLRILVLVFIFIFSGCASWENYKGVENRWRDDALPEIVIGKTTQSDVATILGPPSQVLSFSDKVIFYYLLEQQKGKGFFFIVYNKAQSKTIYDRAIFFFDGSGILTDYAYSVEKAEMEND